MKNKKAIVLLMASAIVLSLVGCAGSTSEAAEASSEIPLAEAISDEPVEAASIENSDSEAADSASAIDNSALQDDQFQYNGKIISVMDDLNALINAFDYSKPETYDIQSFYTSKDHSVTLETLKKDEIEYPFSITINYSGIYTKRNINVGSSRDEVIKAYGEPNVAQPLATGPDGKELTKEEMIAQFGEELIYDLGDYTISFCTNPSDGSVSSISYMNDDSHDKFSWS